MGCKVELVLADGSLSVDSVYAEGNISNAVMNAKQLPEELFSLLNRLHRLRLLHLEVTGGEHDRTRLRSIATLHSLRELELIGRDVNDEVLPYVLSLTNLESLTIWDASISETGLVRLPNLKALKRLDLCNIRTITRSDLESIAKLRELEKLRVYARVEGELSVLTALPKLHAIAICGTNINTMLTEVSSIATVREVEIYRSELDAATAECLGAIKSLESLRIECCTVKPDALKGLKTLELKSLGCVNIDAETLSELAKIIAEGSGTLTISN